MTPDEQKKIEQWSYFDTLGPRELFEVAANEQIRGYLGPIPEAELQAYREHLAAA